MRAIHRINLISYKNNILKNLGLQFCGLLSNYYSSIAYSKDGLSRIFIDIAKYKSLISMFGCEEVENRFKALRCLIDIYVIKNEEKAIVSYISTEKEGTLQHEKEETINKFINNKMLQER